MRRIPRTPSSSSNNNQHNLPVIVIDDSTDEDTSILLPETPPPRRVVEQQQRQRENLPIAVSDDETTLNPFSPGGSPLYAPSSPQLPLNSLDWSDSEDSSEYESSSDEDETPNHNNIDDFLDRLTREEERERVTTHQTHPPVVQYPSVVNSNNNYNNYNYLQSRLINNTNSNNNINLTLPFVNNNNNSSNNSSNSSSSNNNSNRNLLHQHRLQSTSAIAARIPIQASRRFITPTTSSTNRNTPFASASNHANHHHHQHLFTNRNNIIGIQRNNDHHDTPFERMVEEHILAQVIARTQRHQVGGAIHPLMFVNRDFDDRDYEMLLALDDNVEKASKKTAASVVGKLPIVHIEEKECTCSICLEDLEVGSFASEIPFCNHKFHTECIEKWLKDYGHTCPVCKQEVTEIDFNHAKIIKEEVNNKRKGFSNKNVTESRFKKKKVE